MQTIEDFQNRINKLLEFDENGFSKDRITATAERLARAADALLVEMQFSFVENSDRINEMADMSLQTRISDILLITSELCSQLYLDLEGVALIAEESARHIREHSMDASPAKPETSTLRAATDNELLSAKNLQQHECRKDGNCLIHQIRRNSSPESCSHHALSGQHESFYNVITRMPRNTAKNIGRDYRSIFLNQ